MKKSIYELYTDGNLDKIHKLTKNDLENIITNTVLSYKENKYIENIKKVLIEDDEPTETYCFLNYDELYKRIERWFSTFPNIQPFYAVKAFPECGVINIMSNLGCMCYDCASKGEIEKILNAGVDATHIIFANPVKPIDHLQYAKNHNVIYMTLDNIDEVGKIAKIYNDVKAQLVVRIGVDDSHSTIALGSKFGCSIEEGKDIIKKCKELNQDVVGVSFHVGSGCEDKHAWSKAVRDAKIVYYFYKQLFDYGEELGYNFKLLDLGGGWPGCENDISCDDIAPEVYKTIEELYDLSKIKVIAEPGRFFCEPILSLCSIYI